MSSLKFKQFHNLASDEKLLTNFEQNKKPRYDICNCDITLSDVNTIRVHFFDHVLSQFIHESSSIVKLYVGPIHINILEKMTLGSSLVNINNIKEELSVYNSGKDGYHENICIINNCGLRTPLMYCLCFEHTEQWNLRLLNYVHKHACDECFIKRKSHCISGIMKLHVSLNSDIARYILSFCDITSLYKCNGHMKPVSYVCNLCPKKDGHCVIL